MNVFYMYYDRIDLLPTKQMLYNPIVRIYKYKAREMDSNSKTSRVTKPKQDLSELHNFHQSIIPMHTDENVVHQFTCHFFLSLSCTCFGVSACTDYFSVELFNNWTFFPFLQSSISRLWEWHTQSHTTSQEKRHCTQPKMIKRKRYTLDQQNKTLEYLNTCKGSQDEKQKKPNTIKSKRTKVNSRRTSYIDIRFRI